MTIKHSLDQILNKLDYTNHQCSPVAMIAAALPEDDLTDAHKALTADSDATYRPALELLLDQIDFTKGACGPFEMVGACLPQTVIAIARASLNL